jgi:hypothetical protein
MAAESVPAEPEHLGLRGRELRGCRIIRVQNSAVGFHLILEDSRFRRAILFQRVVAIQMVRREIQKHADVRAKRFDQLQLKAAELYYSDSGVARLLH